MEGTSHSGRTHAAPAPQATAAPARPAAAQQPPVLLLQLQRSIGNQAVQQLLGEPSAARDQPPNANQPAATEAAPAVRPASLLVEDDATPAAGQMTRSAFLAELRASVCAAADSAFAGTEHESRGCPWIEGMLRFYEDKDAARLERDLLAYVPAAAGAASAREALGAIAERANADVAAWVATGQVALPPGLPGAALLGGGLGGLLGGVLRKARSGSSSPPANDDPAAVAARLGPGRPLPGDQRARMERAMGQRFGDVRLHHDAGAARLAGGLSARAFAVGRHVAFGAGEFRPGTPVGDALLAHELAHVVQQRDARPAVASNRGARENLLERDADSAAAGAVATLWGGGRPSPGGGRRRSGLALQRCPKRTELVTPAEADLWLGERYGANITAAIAAGLPRISAQTTEINVVAEPIFRREWEGFNTWSEQQSSNFTRSDYNRLVAFVDRRVTPPRVWIRQDRQRTDTVLHEAVHLHAHPNFEQAAPQWRIDEGVTEYFSRQIAEQQDLAITGAYEEPYQAVRRLVAVSGEEPLRRAYFQGQFEPIVNAVDGRLGQGTFDEWLYLVVVGSYERAQELLAGRSSSPPSGEPLRLQRCGPEPGKPANKYQGYVIEGVKKAKDIGFGVQWQPGESCDSKPINPETKKRVDGFDTDYWVKPQGECKLTVKPDVSPALAIRQLFNPERLSRWQIDCGQFAQLPHLYASRMTLIDQAGGDVKRGEAMFDQRFPQIELKQLGTTGLKTRVLWGRRGPDEPMREFEIAASGSGGLTRDTAAGKDAVEKKDGRSLPLAKVLDAAPIGSRVVFTNNNFLRGGYEAFGVENTIKVGQGVYAAHPLRSGVFGTNQFLTEEHIVDELEKAAEYSGPSTRRNIFISEIEIFQEIGGGGEPP